MTAGKHDARLELAYRRLLHACPRTTAMNAAMSSSRPCSRGRRRTAKADDRRGVRSLCTTASAPPPASPVAPDRTCGSRRAGAGGCGLAHRGGGGRRRRDRRREHLGQPEFYAIRVQLSVPVPAGVGLVLATFPVALAFLSGNRPRRTSVGCARGDRGDRVRRVAVCPRCSHPERAHRHLGRHDDGIPNVPDETLGRRTASGSSRCSACPPCCSSSHVRPQTTGDGSGMEQRSQGCSAPRSSSSRRPTCSHGRAWQCWGRKGPARPAPSLHDTGLTQGVADHACSGRGLARRPPTSVPKPDGRFRHVAADTGLCHGNPRQHD